MPPHKPHPFVESYDQKLAEFEEKLTFFSNQIDSLERFDDVAAARIVLDLTCRYVSIAYQNVFYINAFYSGKQKPFGHRSQEAVNEGRINLKQIKKSIGDYNKEIRSYLVSAERNKKHIPDFLFKLSQLIPFQIFDCLPGLDKKSMLKLNQIFSRQYLLYASVNMKLTRRAVFLLRENGFSDEMHDLLKNRILDRLVFFKDTIAILNDCFLDMAEFKETIDKKLEKLVDLIKNNRYLISLEIFSLLKIDSECAAQFLSLSNNIIYFCELFLPELEKKVEDVEKGLLGESVGYIECLLKTCLITKIIANKHRQEALLTGSPCLEVEDERLERCFEQLKMLKKKVFSAESSSFSTEVSDLTAENTLSLEKIFPSEAQGINQKQVKYQLEVFRYFFKISQYVDVNCFLEIPDDISSEINASKAKRIQSLIEMLKSDHETFENAIMVNAVEESELPRHLIDLRKVCYLNYEDAMLQLQFELIKIDGCYSEISLKYLLESSTHSAVSLHSRFVLLCCFSRFYLSRLDSLTWQDTQHLIDSLMLIYCLISKKGIAEHSNKRIERKDVKKFGEYLHATAQKMLDEFLSSLKRDPKVECCSINEKKRIDILILLFELTGKILFIDLQSRIKLTLSIQKKLGIDYSYQDVLSEKSKSITAEFYLESFSIRHSPTYYIYRDASDGLAYLDEFKKINCKNELEDKFIDLNKIISEFELILELSSSNGKIDIQHIQKFRKALINYREALRNPSYKHYVDVFYEELNMLDLYGGIKFQGSERYKQYHFVNELIPHVNVIKSMIGSDSYEAVKDFHAKNSFGLYKKVVNGLVECSSDKMLLILSSFLRLFFKMQAEMLFLELKQEIAQLKMKSENLTHSKEELEQKLASIKEHLKGISDRIDIFCEDVEKLEIKLNYKNNPFYFAENDMDLFFEANMYANDSLFCINQSIGLLNRQKQEAQNALEVISAEPRKAKRRNKKAKKQQEPKIVEPISVSQPVTISEDRSTISLVYYGFPVANANAKKSLSYPEQINLNGKKYTKAMIDFGLGFYVIENDILQYHSDRKENGKIKEPHALVIRKYKERYHIYVPQLQVGHVCIYDNVIDIPYKSDSYMSITDQNIPAFCKKGSIQELDLLFEKELDKYNFSKKVNIALITTVQICVLFSTIIEKRYINILTGINNMFPLFEISYRGAVVADMLRQSLGLDARGPCDLDTVVSIKDKEECLVEEALQKAGFVKGGNAYLWYPAHQYTGKIVELKKQNFYGGGGPEFCIEKNEVPDYLHTALTYKVEGGLIEISTGALMAALLGQLKTVLEPHQTFSRSPLSIVRGVHRLLGHGFIFYANLKAGFKDYVKYFSVENLNANKINWRYLNAKLTSYAEKHGYEFWELLIENGIIQLLLFNDSAVELEVKLIFDELKAKGQLMPLDIFEACWLAYKKNGGKRLSSELVRLNGFSEDKAYQNLYVGGKRSMNPASLPLTFNPLPPGDIPGELMSPYPAGYGSMWGTVYRPHLPAVQQGIAAAYLPLPEVNETPNGFGAK